MLPSSTEERSSWDGSTGGQPVCDVSLRHIAEYKFDAACFGHVRPSPTSRRSSLPNLRQIARSDRQLNGGQLPFSLGVITADVRK